MLRVLLLLSSDLRAPTSDSPTMTRILSELSYQSGGKYRFVLTGDLIVDLDKGLRGFHVLRDKDTTWAILDRDQLTIRAGYAFDGCSPAGKVFGRWFGTPTPRNAVAAAAVHDCLRGYLKLPCIGYTRKDTDDIFHDMLKTAGFPLGGVYHGAVAGPWGDLYMRLTGNRPSSANCKCHPLHRSPPLEF